MNKADKRFNERLARLGSQEVTAPQHVEAPSPVRPATREKSALMKPLMILGCTGLTLSLTLVFFADRIADQITETKLAAATMISAFALDQDDEDQPKTLTAFDVATNPPTAMMATFGKMHAEQIAKYGNPDNLPTEGLDHKSASGQDIANRMDRYLVPPLQ